MRAWRTWLGWHRGLPTPPAEQRPLTLAVLSRLLADTSRLYVAGWRNLGGGWGRAARDLQAAQEERDRARDEAEASRLAAGAARTARGLPAALERWLAPRLALLGDALLQFARGYREGRAAPGWKVDWSDVLPRREEEGEQPDEAHHHKKQ